MLPAQQHLPKEMQTTNILSYAFCPIHVLKVKHFELCWISTCIPNSCSFRLDHSGGPDTNYS